MNIRVNLDQLNPIIFTLGYEQSNIEDFITTLKSSGIETLVDVRRFPISRKKGFSKTAFSTALNNAGINYIHLLELGCPNTIRDNYKLNHDWQTYTKEFLTYLHTQQLLINELACLSHKASICLTCFEKDYRFCHRSMVANAIAKKNSGQIQHLTVKKAINSHLAV